MTACLSPNGLNTYARNDRTDRLIVATLDGIGILERNGSERPWTLAARALEGCHVSSLLWEPEGQGLFAGVHGGGLYFSADDGRSWESKSRGITVDHLFSLASTTQNGKTVLYAGTEPAHLFRSTDYGDSWHELPALRQVPEIDKWMFPGAPHEAHLKTLAVDPRDPSRIYAGIEQGALLVSTDGGEGWRELSGYAREDDEVYKDVHMVMLRPSNPDELYMTAGMGLYHSADRGANWEHLSNRQARVGYPDQFQFSPVDDRILFMAGAARNPGTWRQSHDAESTVVRSTDGGYTWEEAGNGLPEHMHDNIEAMAMVGGENGFDLFAGTTDGDVYLSADGAGSWSRIASGLAPISKGGHYVPLRVPVA